MVIPMLGYILTSPFLCYILFDDRKGESKEIGNEIGNEKEAEIGESGSLDTQQMT